MDEEGGVPYKKLALILRDADMMGSYHNNSSGVLETLFIGLFLESKLKFPDLTIEQFHKNQESFCANMVKWNTTWAKRKAQVQNWQDRHLEVAKVVTKDSNYISYFATKGIITP